MITTSLQDQIKYVDRCVNPDYIIILQNKANENMDFSQFKIMGLEDPVVIPKYREYTASCGPVQGEEGKLRIIVTENLGNTTVFAMVIREHSKEKWQEKLRRDYGIKQFTPRPIIDYDSFGDRDLSGLN